MSRQALTPLPRRNLIGAAACSLLFGIGTAASAQPVPDGEALASQERCNICHAVDETLIGPPYRAIAARHSTDRELQIEVLARKVVHGGGGNWGIVPMVPNEHVSLDEARRIVAWILSLNQ